MSLDTARTNIFNHIETNWSDCDVLYQGQKITDAYIKRQTPWMYVMLKWGKQSQHSMPSPDAYFAMPAIIPIRLYVRERSGIAIMDQLTDDIFSLFRAQQINNVTITDMDIDNDQNSKGWNIRFISISFILRTIESIS